MLADFPHIRQFLFHVGGYSQRPLAEIPYCKFLRIFAENQVGGRAEKDDKYQ
jgi:hypothetical protein